MKLHSRTIIQVIVTLLLAVTMMLLSGCILEIIQPDTVKAGQPFEALVKIDPEITGTYPIYIGIQLPSDWQVIGSPIYTDGLIGSFTYSPTAIASLDAQFGTLTGTTWWAGAGPSIPVTGGLTVTIQANLQSSIVASGVYTLYYVDGIYTDTLTWRVVNNRPITVTAITYLTYIPLVLKNYPSDNTTPTATPTRTPTPSPTFTPTPGIVPNPGLWSGQSAQSDIIIFEVTSDSSTISQFSTMILCSGTYYIKYFYNIPIVNGSFHSIQSSNEITGTFTSATNVFGIYRIYHSSNCTRNGTAWVATP